MSLHVYQTHAYKNAKITKIEEIAGELVSHIFNNYKVIGDKKEGKNRGLLTKKGHVLT